MALSCCPVFSLAIFVILRGQKKAHSLPKPGSAILQSCPVAFVRYLAAATKGFRCRRKWDSRFLA
jgi:hypothetical protein